MFLILSRTYTKPKLRTAQFHTVSVNRDSNYISIKKTMGSINIFHTTVGAQYWKQIYSIISANISEARKIVLMFRTEVNIERQGHIWQNWHQTVSISFLRANFFLRANQTASVEIKRYFSRSLPSAIISFLTKLIKIQGYSHWNTVEIRKV